MASAPLRAALQSALTDEERTEAILRDRTKIPEEILVQRRLSEVYLTPQLALDYGLIHEIRDFIIPAGNQIIQI